MYNMLYRKYDNFPQRKKVYTNKLQPVELIHMDFPFCNVTYIRGSTSMITVVCVKTKMLWVFPTAYKLPPVRIICFILPEF